MPRKLAIFVEGQTEQIFVRRLLEEIAGRRNVHFEEMVLSGKGEKRILRLEEPANMGARYYAQIVNSANDEKVVSDIREHHPRLVREGFSLILGIRDVLPYPNSKLPLLRGATAKVLPTGSPPVHVVFAIREIEAWFLAEDSHFERIHRRLNPGRLLTEVREEFRIDTSTMNVEGDVEHPSETLHAIYQLEHRSYRKVRDQVQRTVEALDFARLYLELPDRVSALRELRDHIDGFLA